MICNNCGRELNIDAKFCPSCGTPVTQTQIQAYKNFSIKEFLSLGWLVVKNNFIPSFLITVIILLGLLIPNHGFGVILSLLISIYSLFLLTRIALAVPEGKFKLNKEEFYLTKGNTLNFIITYFLYYLAIIIGLTLFIVPGIYLLARLSMWNYIILDKGGSPIEVLTKSWELTKGYTFKLLQWEVISIVIIILGVLIMFIGIVIAFPLIVFSEYFIYKKLSYGK
jgi:hypothetical protein